MFSKRFSYARSINLSLLKCKRVFKTFLCDKRKKIIKIEIAIKGSFFYRIIKFDV